MYWDLTNSWLCVIVELEKLRKTMALSHKGQSTIEYLLVFTGVVVVMIVFLAQPGSAYKNKLNQTYGNATDTLVVTANAFYNSF